MTTYTKGLLYISYVNHDIGPCCIHVAVKIYMTYSKIFNFLSNKLKDSFLVANHEGIISQKKKFVTSIAC